MHAGVIPQPTRKDRFSHRRYDTTRREGPHQLRHWYASGLGDGASIIDLAEYLGHHDPAITLRICGHMQPHSHDKARKIIDGRMYRPHPVAIQKPAQ